MSAAQQGALLQEGLTVVIAGRPNVGKSRLLNRLAERDSAIVTDIPGTTRDVIREHIQIDGLPLHILDTAGLRETSDQVEREGVRRARVAISQASHVLLVVDDRFPNEGEELIPDLTSGIRVTRVHNKIDLTGNDPRIESNATGDRLYLSAETGSGLDLLRRHLKECAGYRGDADGLFSARRRHVDALQRAHAAVASAKTNVASKRAELLADDLRAAHEALGEITGRFTPEDLLGSIFGSFCIGK
jgi:tRNA modification GTPase